MTGGAKDDSVRRHPAAQQLRNRLVFAWRYRLGEADQQVHHRPVFSWCRRLGDEQLQRDRTLP